MRHSRSCPWRLAHVLGASFVLTWAGWSDTARAEGSLEGKWRQGPLREDFTVQQWLSGCGPAPASGSTGGGETVEIRAEGDELAFLGGGRVFRTNQCYDQLPNLTRDAHSRAASGRSWSTRCVTPANDPRKALLQTRVDAVGDNQIEMRETGRYEVVLAEGRCLADISRSRTYTRIENAENPNPKVRHLVKVEEIN